MLLSLKVNMSLKGNNSTLAKKLITSPLFVRKAPNGKLSFLLNLKDLASSAAAEA